MVRRPDRTAEPVHAAGPSTSSTVWPPGSCRSADDPLFLPHLGGRVSPSQPTLRGCWAGLTWSHTAAHLYRAVLEGVALEYCLYRDVLRALNPELTIREIRVTGGGQQSACGTRSRPTPCRSRSCRSRGAKGHRWVRHCWPATAWGCSTISTPRPTLDQHGQDRAAPTGSWPAHYRVAPGPVSATPGSDAAVGRAGRRNRRMTDAVVRPP